jgi:hypothetical protein
MALYRSTGCSDSLENPNNSLRGLESNGKDKEALRLAKSILDVYVPSEGRPTRRSSGGMQAYVDDYDYKLIAETLQLASAGALESSILVLKDLFCKSIALKSTNSADDDYSYIWRPATALGFPNPCPPVDGETLCRYRNRCGPSCSAHSVIPLYFHESKISPELRIRADASGNLTGFQR